MKKRIPFWPLILVGVLLAAILCIRIGLRLTQSGDPRPLQVDLSGSAAVKNVDAHAVPWGGGSLHLSYDNQDDTPCVVTLFQYGPFGLRYPILTLETEAHSRGEDQVWSGLWGDCTTYYVIAEATDGGQVKGKLSLHQ